MLAAWPPRLYKVAGYAWPLLQRTAAASVAWVIAKYVVGHQAPFFAPIVAIISLNAQLGERGANAVRLLTGVFVGIVVGELALAIFGGDLGTLTLATFTALVIARAITNVRIALNQAAGSAILTVAIASGQVGPQRLIDALIGVGVALVFSQILFSPEPVALLRSAEAAALGSMADGLGLTAEALERDDDELALESVNRLRYLRDRLGELERLRQASGRIARHSLVWRWEMAPVVAENESVGRLDLLGGSCIMLARMAAATSSPERQALAPIVRDLASALANLAKKLDDRHVRQRAADQALEVARRLPRSNAPPGSTLQTALLVARIAAVDLMVFAGVDPEEVDAAMRERTREPRVSAPLRAPRVPFRLHRRQRGR